MGLIKAAMGAAGSVMAVSYTHLKAKRLGIYDSVSFLGVQKDTSIWYQAMDVFLMPSLFEGLPVVGIEAQASGLPCVFSDTITDEILLSDRAVRLSLEQPDEAWAKELIRLGTADRDRAEGRSVVRLSLIHI